ncbi:hypothetical protein GCM10027610_100940 [Dactylosporangium cerinum]
MVVGGLALAGGLAATGLVPGDSTQATVEHCSVRYSGSPETRSTKCTGHWSRFGATFTGEIDGVEVVSFWQVIPPYPGPGEWGEVAVPDDDAVRVRPAVAVPGLATVTPWKVWSVRVALAVEAVSWIVLLVHLVWARRRKPVTA